MAIVVATVFAGPASAAPRHAGGVRTTAVPRAVQAERHASDLALGSACSATMAPIGFGATPARGESVVVSVTVVCPSALRYQLVLDQPGGCAATRALSGPGGTLAYRVLTPQGDTWCDGSAGTAVVAGVGTGQAQTFAATAVIVDDIGRKHAGSFTGTLTGSIEVVP